MKNIFLTGATGFLGSEIVKQILKNSEDRVYILVKDSDPEFAGKRVYNLLTESDDSGFFHDLICKRTHIVLGDITERELALSLNDKTMLADTVDIIIHSAASTALNLDLNIIEKINVQGTKNILDFAAHYLKKSVKVNHISTAYVAGTTNGVFKESDLDLGQSFNNNYEISKFNAENIIDDYRKRGMFINILRPGIILGRFSDGKTTKFGMLYQPLRFFSEGLIDSIPLNPEGNLYLINVDIAARIIQKIASCSKIINGSFHLLSPIGQKLDFILNLASEYFGFDPVKIGKSSTSSSAVQKKMLLPYEPYFNCLIDFDTNHTFSILSRYGLRIPEFDENVYLRLFKYCDRIGFITRKAGKCY